MRINIIGLGGVGTIVANNLCKFLYYKRELADEEIVINLCDGDSYELKNSERQFFSGYGNKAKTKCDELRKEYGSRIQYNYFPFFVDSENIKSFVHDGDIILLSVDNFKTRYVLAEYCKTLQNIILISGGNEWDDGNVQMFCKIDGNDILPNIDKYHPEIRNPEDGSPQELSCDELQQTSGPQLLFTNMMVATYMLVAFYNLIISKQIKYSEVYFDIPTMKADSKIRKP